jgi:hypothetical protein
MANSQAGKEQALAPASGLSSNGRLSIPPFKMVSQTNNIKWKECKPMQRCFTALKKI